MLHICTLIYFTIKRNQIYRFFADLPAVDQLRVALDFLSNFVGKFVPVDLHLSDFTAVTEARLVKVIERRSARAMRYAGKLAAASSADPPQHLGPAWRPTST